MGFLHIPDDEPSWGRPGPRPFESTLAMVDRMVKLLLPDGGRLLLTGFAPWGLVVDNPSGAFVASPRALAALAQSDAPIPSSGALVAKGPRIEIVSAVLPVTDAALDPGSATAIPSLHATFRPDACSKRTGTRPPSSRKVPATRTCCCTASAGRPTPGER